MDANELGRWTRFAAKGGIGRGTAVADCVAEQEDDLMFLQGDEITILMQLPGEEDLYLGYCEGVVGRFNGQDVRFHSKLKKPVMTKRFSTAAVGSSRPSSSLSALTAVTQGGRDSVPPPSHHRTPSNFSATAESPRLPSLSQPHSSPPPAAHSPLPAPLLLPQTATHLRSVSYSSISTALDSAPRTPADFSKEFRDSVHVLSFVRDVDSPTEIDADITISAVDLSLDPADTAPHSLKTSPALDPEPRSPVRSSSQDTLNNDETEPVSFLESEPTARFSRLSANSDGEVGIGLSLLQDFINGGADDSDSLASNRSSYQSVVVSPSNTINHTSIPDADLPTENPIHSEHPPASPTSPASQHDLSTTSQSPVPPPARDAISRNSTQPSVTDSEYGGEDWEGASDIYDNYRYSRFSMASKVSRLSKGSMHTVTSAFGLEVPPPVPRDTSRSSLDSQRPTRSKFGSLGDPSQPAEGVTASVDSAVSSTVATPLDVKVTAVSPERKKTDEGKHVPSPLTFAPGIISFGTGTAASETNTSPLLHTTFASPLGSPSAHSTNAFLSPNPSSPTYPSAIGGIASALRQKIEMDRAVSPAAGRQRSVSPSPSTLSENQGHPPSVNRLSSQPIVQDDDDNGGPSTDTPDAQVQERESGSLERVSSPESAPPTTALASAGSVVVSEKAALQSTYVVANPPLPYTPLAAPSENHAQLDVQATSSSSPQTDPSLPVARPLNLSRSPTSPSARQSLFLPHPHAPKPTLSPTGPMYGRAPPPVSPLSPPTGPLPGSLVHTLNILYSHRFDQGLFRRTLYGKFDQDLAHSLGPIPVSFTLEPPQSIPANRISPPNRPKHQSVVPPDLSHQSSTTGAPTVASTDSNGLNQGVMGKTIPRANFFPKVQTPRPRSRSFSGFDASSVASESVPKERSAEEGYPSSVVPPQPISKRSKSASATVQSSKGGPQRGLMPHKPSPLSLSHNIVVAPHPTSPMSPIKPPPSPLSQPPIIAPQNPVPSDEEKTQQKTPPSLESRTFQHKPSASQTTLPASPKSDVPPSPLAVNIPTAANSSPLPELSQSPPLRSSPEIVRIPSRSPPVIRHSRSSLSGKRYPGREPSPSRSSMQGRRSGETDSDGRSVTSPHLLGSPPSSGHLGRSGSLRSKLSLPTLRIRNSERSFQYDSLSPTLNTSPSENDLRTVQIKDTDFELVKPVVVSSPKEDSFPLPSPVNPDSSLRAGSPALSSLSGSNTAFARPPSPPVIQTPPAPTRPLDPADVEAHRQRELRWISTMASVPPSQSRKSKKIRKLLQEGVPASVRYLVWAHLTDSKSKRMDGLYAKLGKRERVSAVANIERDAKRCFVDKPELQDGSLVNLLQAYLTMVPDILYSRGLTAIAGCLLMQSPEEDAFWTFISLMDTHLRSYFSSSAMQLEVDGSLFGKVLEANEPALAKKVFIDMALSPVTICRPWFSSLFVDVLPIDYLHRVWDIFLFEGVGFLFRVGLAILTSCKQAIMTTNSRDAVFDILMYPPLTSLPTTPDALIDLALSVKLKEGDLQKQRAKMEAQLKRSTQSTRGLLPQSGRVSVSTPAISLPKS